MNKSFEVKVVIRVDMLERCTKMLHNPGFEVHIS